MDTNLDLDFLGLLDTVSSEVSHKILLLYTQQDGLTLTETANLIEEKISTVRDHIKKLIEAYFIYKKEKQYYMSNFGSFVMKYLSNLEIFNKTRQVFGQIPGELIPSEFIRDLIPYIADIKIESDPWQFMLTSTGILNQIREDLGSGTFELKILGWQSLSLSIDIMEKYFSNVPFEKESLNRFLTDLNFQLITDKEILKDIKESPQIQKIINNIEIQDRFFICDTVQNFEFTLFKYNEIIQFFLNEKDALGVGHHFVLKNNKNAVEFFDKVFQYYLAQSKPLTEYI